MTETTRLRIALKFDPGFIENQASLLPALAWASVLSPDRTNAGQTRQLEDEGLSNTRPPAGEAGRSVRVWSTAL
jgi:hypothetical protein